MPTQELRRHDAQGRQNRHHERELRNQTAPDDEWHRHAEVAVDRDHRGKVAALEPEQHFQGGGQEPLIARDRARQEQHHAYRQRGDDQALLTLIKRGRQERPDLVDDDRRSEQTAEGKRDLQREHERLGGAREDEPAAGKVGRDRPLQHFDDVDFPEQPPANDRAHKDGEQAPQNAPAQFLEVIEKRHLTARGRRRRGGRHCRGYGQRVGLLGPEALLILPREIGLGGARIPRDHARIEGPRQRLIPVLLSEDALLVQR